MRPGLALPAAYAWVLSAGGAGMQMPWKLTFFGCAVGVILTWASLTLTFDTREDAIYNLAATLDGSPLRFGDGFNSITAFYNRVLFPGAHSALVRLGVLNPYEWYIILRLLTFAAAFTIFARVAHGLSGGDTRNAVVATLLLALATLATFNRPWELPSDALDIICLTLGASAALRGRYIVCLAIALVFAANRESAAFLGLIWIALAPSPIGLRKVAEGAAVSILSYGAVLAIRALVGAEGGVGNSFMLFQNITDVGSALSSANPTSWLVVGICTFVLFLPLLDFRAAGTRRFVAAAMMLFAPCLLFGLINELRIFLPLYVLLALASAVGAEKPASTDSPPA